MSKTWTCGECPWFSPLAYSDGTSDLGECICSHGNIGKTEPICVIRRMFCVTRDEVRRLRSKLKARVYLACFAEAERRELEAALRVAREALDDIKVFANNTDDELGYNRIVDSAFTKINSILGAARKASEG